MPELTAVQFASRFVTLVLKGNGLPRKALDRHVLMVSAYIGLEPGRKYSEPELNELLKHWSASFGDNVCLDHVSLRRMLVDERYLVRDAAGKTYSAKSEGLPYTIDRTIWSVNLHDLINDTLNEKENRKRARQKESER